VRRLLRRASFVVADCPRRLCGQNGNSPKYALQNFMLGFVPRVALAAKNRRWRGTLCTLAYHQYFSTLGTTYHFW